MLLVIHTMGNELRIPVEPRDHHKFHEELVTACMGTGSVISINGWHLVFSHISAWTFEDEDASPPAQASL